MTNVNKSNNAEMNFSHIYPAGRSSSQPVQPFFSPQRYLQRETPRAAAEVAKRVLLHWQHGPQYEVLQLHYLASATHSIGLTDDALWLLEPFGGPPFLSFLEST